MTTSACVCGKLFRGRPAKDRLLVLLQDKHAVQTSKNRSILKALGCHDNWFRRLT